MTALSWILQLVIMWLVGLVFGGFFALAGSLFVLGFPHNYGRNIFFAGSIFGCLIGIGIAVVHILTGWLYGNIDIAVLAIPTAIWGIILSNKFK